MNQHGFTASANESWRRFSPRRIARPWNFVVKLTPKATRTYANACNRDADFYAFMKSLETYEQTMDTETLFILGTDSELLRFWIARDRPEARRGSEAAGLRGR